MKTPLWNLEKTHAAELAKAKAEYVQPTGTKIDQAREIISRCEARDASMLEQALAMEAAGDEDGCWFAMAGRAENTRFLARMRADLAKLERDFASESQREAAGTADEKPDGQAENDQGLGRRDETPPRQ